MLAEALTGADSHSPRFEDPLADVGSRRDAASVLAGGARLLRSHEPYRPEYRTAIYLVRDVRDVVVSYYREQRALGEFAGELPDFVDQFARGRIDGYGTWFDHVSSWLRAHRLRSGVLLLRYEDMRADTFCGLKMLLEFLGRPMPGARLREIVARNSVERELRHGPRGGDEWAGLWRGNRPWRARAASLGGWRTELTETDLQRLGPATGLLRELGYED